MMNARISNTRRRAIYKRDGYRCALCDSTKYLQIHHCIPRGQGGTDNAMNLVCLCADCHALAHGIRPNDWWEISKEDVDQAIVEYLADYYAPDWNPWKREERP